MKIISTHSSMLLSRLILWGLTKKGLPAPKASHVAIIFDDRWVLHSNLLGVHIQWAPHFLKNQSVMDEIDYELSLESEEQVYQGLVDECEGLSYDFPGFFYQGWRILLWKLFGRPFPKNNAWNSRGALLCYELAERLPFWITGAENLEKRMFTPDEFIALLKAAKTQG